jgi:hypothetical protein
MSGRGGGGDAMQLRRDGMSDRGVGGNVWQRRSGVSGRVGVRVVEKRQAEEERVCHSEEEGGCLAEEEGLCHIEEKGMSGRVGGGCQAEEDGGGVGGCQAEEEGERGRGMSGRGGNSGVAKRKRKEEVAK